MNDLRVINSLYDLERPAIVLAFRTGSRLLGLREDIGEIAFQARHDLVQTSQRDALLALFEPMKR